MMSPELETPTLIGPTVPNPEPSNVARRTANVSPDPAEPSGNPPIEITTEKAYLSDVL